MGKLKDQLIQLEERGIIAWSEKYEQYYLANCAQNVEFNLEEYNRRNTRSSHSYGRGTEL